MVGSFSIRVYVCTCDICGNVEEVRSGRKIKILNGATACRSIGWSFGKDGKTTICDKCRKRIVTDKHRFK